MVMQLMLVPLGCPYDAAARVLKGNVLENSLPASALERARADQEVAIAAPLLMVAVTRPGQPRVDVWVGLDESSRLLKPWWKVRCGASWFVQDDDVILGTEAAEVEMRACGDKLFSP